MMKYNDDGKEPCDLPLAPALSFRYAFLSHCR